MSQYRVCNSLIIICLWKYFDEETLSQPVSGVAGGCATAITKLSGSSENWTHKSFCTIGDSWRTIDKLCLRQALRRTGGFCSALRTVQSVEGETHADDGVPYCPELMLLRMLPQSRVLMLLVWLFTELMNAAQVFLIERPLLMQSASVHDTF